MLAKARQFGLASSSHVLKVERHWALGSVKSIALTQTSYLPTTYGVDYQLMDSSEVVVEGLGASTELTIRASTRRVALFPGGFAEHCSAEFESFA